MTPFTRRVIHILKQIPAGKVMTYGQVAKAARSPRAARQVVRILHSMSKKYHLPWHRVINAKGQIAIKDDEARMEQKWLLDSEGVEISLSGYVNLEKYQFHYDIQTDENEFDQYSNED
ncbi:MGMT family protein [Oceanobacillus chungangensis]|uniref:DNA methyltransferase n=1 Tax=Oceanobacillus chungangensis TaxID=1229152 RepID=A0A3D8PMY2_9BACI|nr:MGMT family protein [Oceanobacillus chungangensis]RDW16609.1 DNA methyltransferase [Oceanobacillus chungangensis]